MELLKEIVVVGMVVRQEYKTSPYLRTETEKRVTKILPKSPTAAFVLVEEGIGWVKWMLKDEGQEHYFLQREDHDEVLIDLVS